MVRLNEVHRAEIAACYAVLLSRKPKAAGALVLSWNVTSAGKIERADVDANRSTLTDSSFVECVLEDVQSWEFKSGLGETVATGRRFIFTPAKSVGGAARVRDAAL